MDTRAAAEGDSSGAIGPAAVTPSFVPPFLPGDFLPPFVAAAPHNPQFHLHAVAGMRLLVMFLGDAEPALRAEIHAVLRRLGDLLMQRQIRLLAICRPGIEVADAAIRPADCTWIWDPDDGIAASYGVPRDDLEIGGIRPTAFLLRENLQLLARLDAGAPAALGHALEPLLRQVPAPEPYRRQDLHAPILLVPGALPPALCRDLIAYYERRGGTPSGFMRDLGGRTVGLHDPGMKRRTDCPIEDAQLLAVIRRMLLRRVVPEIRKAFCFRASRVERYIVARYDGGEGGFFRAHRDNTSRGTAHRRFAMTVNLNSDGFEGGELCFPEYGRSLYRPPTGAALVFSCSMLHEARPVTAGQRYAFLPFFYDDEAADIRQQNLQFVGTGDRPPPALAAVAAEAEDGAAG